MFLHAFNTWLVANLLHPLIIYIGFGSMNGEFFNDSLPGFYILGFFYSLIFSLPLLAVAWLLLYLIRKTELPAMSKFAAWTFMVTVLPVAVWFGLFIFFGNYELNKEDIEMILPSSVAVFIAVLIRYKQFFKLFNQTHASTSE